MRSEERYLEWMNSMASIFKTVREVFSNRNVLVISLTNMISWGIFNSLWRMWWSLYMLEKLGATISIIGILGMIQSSSSLLFQLPGGILADRFGRRKVIALGTSLRIIAPITFLLARTWQEAIPGFIANAASSIYTPGFNALIAESLPYKKRATAFGAYRTMTSIPRIFMPILSGIFMDRLGLVQGVRIGLILSTIAMTAAFIARTLFLTETLDTVKPSKRSQIEPLKESGKLLSFKSIFFTLRRLLGGTILAMLVVSIISGFGMRMVSSYMTIYGVEVIGLTKTQWGLLQTVASLCGTSLYLLGGMIADRYGRVPCIILARLMLPIRQLGLLFIRDYNQLLMLYSLIGIGGGLGGGSVRGGGFMGGPAWQSLVADVTTSKDRAKVMGLMGTMTGLTGLLAPPLGGYVWEAYSPNILMVISTIIGVFSIPILYLFVKEPKRREK